MSLMPISPFGTPKTMAEIFNFGYERTGVRPLFQVGRVTAGDNVDIYDFQQGTNNYSLSAEGNWIDGTGETFSVTKWYNQTGDSTFDAVYNPGIPNSTPELQLNVDNGWPALKFDGFNTHLYIPSNINLTLTSGADYNDVPGKFNIRYKINAYNGRDRVLFAKQSLNTAVPALNKKEYVQTMLQTGKGRFNLITSPNVATEKNIIGLSATNTPAEFFNDYSVEYDGSKTYDGITHAYNDVDSIPTIDGTTKPVYTGMTGTDAPLTIGCRYYTQVDDGVDTLYAATWTGWINKFRLVK